MNTEQLRYFVSVARYRNFTETAREFYVTQPAVTHQISALEREVGARLFLRTTRNVSLTRAGSSSWRTPSASWTRRSGPWAACASWSPQDVGSCASATSIPPPATFCPG